MIGLLTGAVAGLRGSGIILQAGGIGFVVQVTPRTKEACLSAEGPVTLHTHMAVREDAMELFGFGDENELAFFTLLIGISGIGPKTALNILASASPETLTSAILAKDPAYLTKVAGIGKKMAEKLVLELHEKVEGMGEGVSPEDILALDALSAMGYSTIEARTALRETRTEGTSASDRIKAALRHLSHK